MRLKCPVRETLTSGVNILAFKFSLHKIDWGSFPGTLYGTIK